MRLGSLYNQFWSAEGTQNGKFSVIIQDGSLWYSRGTLARLDWYLYTSRNGNILASKDG
jgi:hypothetical protein